MNKVTDTYYVKYEWDARHAAAEVFKEVFGMDLEVKDLYDSDDTLFWVDDTELVVTVVSEGLFRVDVLKEV
uniref:Uncharacterized protein n=1 Tax=Vibrio phage P018-4 TaxID=3229728 RepID=A0AB39AJ40_9CAUD